MPAGRTTIPWRRWRAVVLVSGSTVVVTVERHHTGAVLADCTGAVVPTTEEREATGVLAMEMDMGEEDTASMAMRDIGCRT